MQTTPENIYQAANGTLSTDPTHGAPYLVRGAVIRDEEAAQIKPLLVSRETSEASEAPENEAPQPTV